MISHTILLELFLNALHIHQMLYLVMIMTNQRSIQEVLFFPQMRPEPKQKVITAQDFVNAGVSEDWAEYLIPAGFASPSDLKEAKATAVQQKLNGYRKKNKLEIPALTPDVIEGWQSGIN